MQKHVNLVDLVKSFPTNIYLQKSASIQKRTSPVKFAHLAEKSGKGSISSLSTKVRRLEAEVESLRGQLRDVRCLEQLETSLQTDSTNYIQLVVVVAIPKEGKVAVEVTFRCGDGPLGAWFERARAGRQRHSLIVFLS